VGFTGAGFLSFIFKLACTTTVWSMLGRKRSARVEPMIRVGSRFILMVAKSSLKYTVE